MIFTSECVVSKFKKQQNEEGSLIDAFVPLYTNIPCDLQLEDGQLDYNNSGRTQDSIKNVVFLELGYDVVPGYRIVVDGTVQLTVEQVIPYKADNHQELICYRDVI